MDRLTKAELVNGFPVCWPNNGSSLGEIIMKNHSYRDIVEKLKYYEDLEEKLFELAAEKLAEYGEH